MKQPAIPIALFGTEKFRNGIADNFLSQIEGNPPRPWTVPFEYSEPA